MTMKRDWMVVDEGINFDGWTVCKVLLTRLKLGIGSSRIRMERDC